jgi:hypothetical protein
MISRRQLLGGLSLLPVSGGLASCAARAMVAPPSSGGTAVPPSYVAPAASWSGAAKSGGVPAVFPAGNVAADPITRTTAKPAIHWVVPSGRRLTPAEDLIIGVDADAGGTTNAFGQRPLYGIKQVDFWVEGGVQSVTVPQFLTWTENGVSKTAFGYFIKLRQSDFVGHLTGEVRVFATAVPNDPTMQNRIIGFDLVSNGQYDGNYPMSVFPRAAGPNPSYPANDWTTTVAASGASFTTLRGAIDAAVAANAEAPLILITQAGPYELDSAAASHAGGKGFMTITTSGNFQAVLRRQAKYFANDTSTLNQWRPGWEGIEFRGAGIVFDQQNFTSILFDNAPAWFNGCKFTNSIGTRDTFYFNGNMHPGFGTPTMSYWDGATVEYQTSHSFPGTGVAVQRYVMNCNLHYMASSLFSGTHYLHNVYVRDISTAWIRVSTPAITIRYSGPAATATISKDVGDPGPSGTGTITVNIGGSVTTIPFGATYASTVSTFDSLAVALNAIPGVTATTVNGRGPMTLRAFNQVSSFVQPIANADIKTAAFSPNCGLDSHASWWQAYAGSTAPIPNRENVIVRNTVTREYGDLGGAWFEMGVWSGGYTANHLQDVIIKGNTCQMLFPDNSTGTGINIGSAELQHTVFENNTSNVPQIRDNIEGANDRVYSSIRNNITGHMIDSALNAFAIGAPALWNNTVPWTNCVYAASAFGDINTDTVGSSGNIPYVNNASVTAPWKALFLNADGGDYRPAVSGTLRNNFKSAANTYDRSGTAYSATDVAGAWSKNAPAPNWPF